MNRRTFLRGALALPVAAAAAPLVALLPAPAAPIYSSIFHPRSFGLKPYAMSFVFHHDTFYKTFAAGMDEVFLAE